MNIEKNNTEIIIYKPQDFDVVQTLNCGQIFRFVIDGDTAYVCSQDKRCEIQFNADKIVIKTKDVDYFYNFFDLDRDYSIIKNTLRKDRFLKSAVDYGYGIRIINNDAFEMIVSFIISANNNIKRIKNSIEYLCVNFGQNKGVYYAFPTLDQLKQATVEDFKKAGLGYRADQMYETIQKLKQKDILNLKQMKPDDQFKFLVSLKGVGEKVANCIMLFGLGVKSVFPVDTWINKVYNKLTNTVTKDRNKITKELTERYQDLSGFAQQYFFYYFRDNKLS
ncbi:MAG: DNA-3-methyladenine glycosylase 2 family protein [Clostridia bacterium]|nr:DNA-3-methyladenine glycosylase 2 family protein [Clostridia bacterium]